MERLAPVRNELFAHTDRAAKLLETARRTLAAEKRRTISADESRELYIETMDEVNREILASLRLIASVVPIAAEPDGTSNTGKRTTRGKK
jgi:hypothetical protein